MQGPLQGLAPGLVAIGPEGCGQQAGDGRVSQGPQGRDEVQVPGRICQAGGEQLLNRRRVLARLQGRGHLVHLAVQRGLSLGRQGRQAGLGPVFGLRAAIRHPRSGGPDSMATSSDRPISLR